MDHDQAIETATSQQLPLPGMASEPRSTGDMTSPSVVPDIKHEATASIISGGASCADDSDAESVGGQRDAMSSKRLMVAIPALSVCLFVSFIDQTSVSTATPAIAEALNTGAATSWIGSSFLISSTAFQLINGRLSDIFGRKSLLLICLALMAIGDLGCGFSKTAVQLFVLRSIAGIGGGGINSLVMVSACLSLSNYQHLIFGRPG
jgi:hypothetical protein